MRKPLFLTCVMLCASSATAQAVGFRTQMSCAGDYYAYCSQHAPGSPGVRKCMRAVGPKLSKACINALIADGEVSKAEVEAQKQKLAGAKAKPKTTDPKKTDVAAAAATKKAQPDVKKDVKKSEVAEKKTDTAPKKVTAEAKAPAAKAAAAAPAPKVTAAAQAPKPVAAAVATTPAVAPAAEPAPQAQIVSLDEATFEALKNRGAVFVAEDEDTTIAAQPPAPPAEPASGTDAVANGDSWQAGTQTDPAAVASTTEEAPAADEPADVATAGDEAVGQSIEYPPGRMSLGRKLSSARAEPEPASWWDQLVDAVTGE